MDKRVAPLKNERRRLRITTLLYKPVVIDCMSTSRSSVWSDDRSPNRFDLYRSLYSRQSFLCLTILSHDQSLRLRFTWSSRTHAYANCHLHKSKAATDKRLRKKWRYVFYNYAYVLSSLYSPNFSWFNAGQTGSLRSKILEMVRTNLCYFYCPTKY